MKHFEYKPPQRYYWTETDDSISTIRNNSFKIFLNVYE